MGGRRGGVRVPGGVEEGFPDGPSTSDHPPRESPLPILQEVEVTASVTERPFERAARARGGGANGQKRAAEPDAERPRA